MGAAHAGVIQW